MFLGMITDFSQIVCQLKIGGGKFCQIYATINFLHVVSYI